MSAGQNQVFLTQSPTRWQRFKWSFRFLVFLAAMAIVLIVIGVSRGFLPGLPRLKQEGDYYKAILNPGKHALMQQTKIDNQYLGFRKYITAKDKGKNIQYVTKADSMQPIAAPVRAAFYDPQDEQSYFSLKNNIDKVNMILPEWMYIDSLADTVFVNNDYRGADIIKASGVRVVAMLSNFSGNDFNGAILRQLLHSPAKKERLINDVVRIVQANHFAGVNVDFEELNENTDEALISFMKELYERMHSLHLIVTQDVSPFNDDYNLAELAKYNDYLFLMAYDQFSESSGPGPISSQKWIEAAVDNAAGKVPPAKLILGIAGYGYDWPDHAAGNTVSYEEALSIASESGGKVKYDNDTYNLSYTYSDDNDSAHTVYFTDAATNFNTMRFAAEYGVSGVALWRMGSEDSRLWSFYAKDMTAQGLEKFNLDTLKYIDASNDVDYIGEGEILDVISTPKPGFIQTDIDSSELLVSEEDYRDLPSVFVMKKYGKKPKSVVLSFDDGPDPKYTPRILDILSQEHVPAVFFMIGINAENNIPIVKRIYNEGFEIGNHTFTHPNIAEISRRRAVLEMSATRLLLECITGHSTTLFRPPYNADSEPETMQELIPVALGKEYNYLTVGESIDPNDWEKGVTADTIFSRVVQQQNLGSIILLHDAGGNREATVQALPRIIKYFKDKGYKFITVADLVNNTRDKLMPAVPKSSGYYLIQFNYYIAAFGFWMSHFLASLFILCIALSILRILTLAFWAVRQQRLSKRKVFSPSVSHLKVSIIVPAYNEEVNAVRSVANLLKSTYPDFDIIFVDDGSKDNTFEKVAAAYRGNGQVKVFTKPNGGKASALNYGILQTEAPLVLCIDADTNLLPEALALMVRHFANEKTGAVAGNVKVGNEINLLTKWQSIEYITSQNFDRNAFAYVNAITVVPGAIGIFRKDALQAAGGFTSDTFAEDCDLTIRLLRAGYKIENEPAAIALTEAPESLKMFLKQRFRWSFGIMQSFWKNRDALFNGEYGSLGWIALPNILIFQILIPLVAPLADILMVISVLTGNGPEILVFYFLYMAIDIAVSLLAFSLERENPLRLVWVIPQRLVYRWLMIYILYKAIRRAIKGELQSWGVLKRTGNVKENPRLKTFKI